MAEGLPAVHLDLRLEDVADAVAYLDSLPPNITVDVIHIRRAASTQTRG